MPFTEDLLHFLWKYRLFNQQNLKTDTGEPLEILSTGYHNKNAGPDFEQAKAKIGDTLWVGNVEIHLCSSDWDLHQHTQNKAYDNVILHVVYQNDKPIFRNDGSKIPTLALNGLVSETIKANYRDLMDNLYWIPCEKRLNEVDYFHVDSWLSRVLIERLEEKSIAVAQLLEEYKGSWDDAFYVMLARNFGFKTNALPFELLARSLPQTIFAKHKDNPLQIEALIFGQAGFLSDAQEDEYPQQLRDEYLFLQKKYQLKPIEHYLWKFLRLRPNNFPTIRLAQFAALVVKSSHLFSKVIEIENVKDLRNLFEKLPVHPYWEEHYHFNKKTVHTSRQLGHESVNNILLNTVVLFVFYYGKQTGKEGFMNRALALLESLPFETNQVTRCFSQLGVKRGGAETSQALLQLKKGYCDTKKCLNCGIGVKILNQA